MLARSYTSLRAVSTGCECIGQGLCHLSVYFSGPRSYTVVRVSKNFRTHIHLHHLEEPTVATTQERVTKIIVDLLGCDESKVVPAARFREDLEADSLDLVELIMQIEEEFSGEISDEDAQKITTVGEAINYIDTRLKPSA